MKPLLALLLSSALPMFADSVPSRGGSVPLGSLPGTVSDSVRIAEHDDSQSRDALSQAAALVRDTDSLGRRNSLQQDSLRSQMEKEMLGRRDSVAYVLMFIAIFPLLPGSNSPIFRGVSVFLGLLFSLGSTSAVSNLVAGLAITYMRPFRVGDRVKLGEVTGDVVEKTMLVTRLRTVKNEDITIPNATILNSPTVNYTSSSSDLGLILSCHPITAPCGTGAAWLP